MISSIVGRRTCRDYLLACFSDVSEDLYHYLRLLEGVCAEFQLCGRSLFASGESAGRRSRFVKAIGLFAMQILLDLPLSLALARSRSLSLALARSRSLSLALSLSLSLRICVSLFVSGFFAYLLLAASWSSRLYKA